MTLELDCRRLFDLLKRLNLARFTDCFFLGSSNSGLEINISWYKSPHYKMPQQCSTQKIPFQRKIFTNYSSARLLKQFQGQSTLNMICMHYGDSVSLVNYGPRHKHGLHHYAHWYIDDKMGTAWELVLSREHLPQSYRAMLHCFNGYFVKNKMRIYKLVSAIWLTTAITTSVNFINLFAVLCKKSSLLIS